MTFQEIDFHIELFRAYLEPKEAQFSYLDLVRKKSGYSKETFFAKLDQAFDNLREAWEDFHSLRTSNTSGDKNIGLPISGFNRYPVLLNFSRTFPSHIYKSTIQDLGKFVLSFKNQNSLKKLRKLIDSKIGNDSFIPEENLLNLIDEVPQNKFNSLRFEEVRNHFKPLFEKKNPSGQNWMKDEDFEIFLKRSFGLQTELPKPKINFGSTGKFAVVKLFYLFYEKCLNEDITQNRKKDPFVKLLKEAFDTDSFNKLSNDNFKKDKNQYEWK
jgi:hypothetical protein